MQDGITELECLLRLFLSKEDELEALALAIIAGDSRSLFLTPYETAEAVGLSFGFGKAGMTGSALFAGIDS